MCDRDAMAIDIYIACWRCSDVAVCYDFVEIETNRQIGRILLISGEIGIKLRKYSVQELHYSPFVKIFVGKFLKQLVYRTFVLTWTLYFVEF